MSYHDETEFFHACRTGDRRAAKKLLRGSPALLQRRDGAGRTGLHVAAKHGRRRVVELLIDEGAHPKIADKQRMYPQHLAFDEGYTELGCDLRDYAKRYGDAYPVQTPAEGELSAQLTFERAPPAPLRTPAVTGLPPPLASADPYETVLEGDGDSVADHNGSGGRSYSFSQNTQPGGGGGARSATSSVTQPPASHVRGGTRQYEAVAGGSTVVDAHAHANEQAAPPPTSPLQPATPVQKLPGAAGSVRQLHRGRREGSPFPMATGGPDAPLGVAHSYVSASAYDPACEHAVAHPRELPQEPSAPEPEAEPAYEVFFAISTPGRPDVEMSLLSTAMLSEIPLAMGLLPSEPHQLQHNGVVLPSETLVADIGFPHTTPTTPVRLEQRPLLVYMKVVTPAPEAASVFVKLRTDQPLAKILNAPGIAPHRNADVVAKWNGHTIDLRNTPGVYNIPATVEDPQTLRLVPRPANPASPAPSLQRVFQQT